MILEMSLLFFQLPNDIVQHIKDVIRNDSARIVMISDEEENRETTAKVKKLQEFIEFIETGTKKSPTVLPMSIEGPGSSANLLILEVFYIPGNERRLEDAAVIAELRESLYEPDDPHKLRAYFVLKDRDGIYEWWEEGGESGMDVLRGLVKTKDFEPVV
jgi:hypothetical protein